MSQHLYAVHIGQLLRHVYAQCTMGIHLHKQHRMITTKKNYSKLHNLFSLDSKAACYGLNDPVIESWWRRNIPHPSRPALGPTRPPIERVPGLSLGKVRPGRGVDHPPPSSVEVKEGVELYTGMGRITTFRSTTGRIYDGDPIIL